MKPTLSRRVGGWLAGPTEILIAGLADAAEVPPRAVPCPPAAAPMRPPRFRDPRLIVAALPGLAQASPPDLTLGDEVRIAGVLAARPNLDDVLCLAGLHPRWARVSAGEVAGFRTFLTGELLELLAEASSLAGRRLGRRRL